MLLKSFISRSAIVLSLVFISYTPFSVLQTEAGAIAPTLILTVETLDGLPATSFANGEEVILRWFIDGEVTNCSINNGIGAIDTSVLPVNGSTTTTPLPDTNTKYTLTCSGVVATVSVNTNKPTVTMGVKQGTTLTIDPIKGYISKADVTWSSTNADRCGLLWREKASAPGIKITETDTDEYWYQYFKSGSVRYGGAVRRLYETNTFYITCYNDNTGEEVTGSVTLNVTDPPPPASPILNIGSDNFPSAVQDTVYGYATTNVWFTSANVTKCTESATYDNGVKYTNPSGWDFNNKLSWDNSTILIATTTVFSVTCSRDEVIIGGVTYPKESITKSVRIEVLPPAGVTSVETWDRTTLPPVTATVTATPNPATKDALSGTAVVSAQVHSEYADYCELEAYDTKGTLGDYSDDSSYELNGWSYLKISGNTDWTTSLVLSKPTRLEVYCVRDYDVVFGDATEIEVGTEKVNTEVSLQEALVPAPDPIAYVYANAVVMDADKVWNTAVERIGFDGIDSGPPVYIRDNGSGSSYGSIKFPFVHPFGANDVYDIHLQYCDESDGKSTFSLYVEGNQVGGDLVSDRVNSLSDECDWSTTYTDMVAGGVTINNGDTITLVCTSPADGERCRFSNIYFGAGNGGEVVTPPVDDQNLDEDISLLWLSKNATECDSYIASDVEGNVYSWASGSLNYGTKIVNISTTTTFSVECSRSDGSTPGQSSVEVKVPADSILQAEILITSAPCYDLAVLGYVDKGPGWGPDPSNGNTCIELVDLVASSSAISIPSDTDETSGSDGVDNVNGIYGNIDALILIKNLGPGVLEAGNPIVYKATLDINDSGTDVRSTTITNFSGFLPVGGESDVLTRTFNNVPFGDHKVCAQVNLDGSPNFPEDPAKLVNNTDCGVVNLPVPHPPMSITTNKTAIRQGQSTTIDWNVNVSYGLTCVAKGAGGLDEEFQATTTPTGSFTTSPLTSTSEYILKCTEPITGESFFETVRVEVIPVFQER